MIDVFHVARQGFAGGYIRDVQELTNNDWLSKKEKGAVDIHDEGAGAFREGGTVFAVAGNNDGHGKKHTLAAALVSHASGTRVLGNDAQGRFLRGFTSMRGATGAGSV